MTISAAVTKRINDGLKQLGKLLHIRMNLTTYVSRHTMAMTLQGNDVPREFTSQALGHRNLTTTNVYLDSFFNKCIRQSS